MSSSETYYTDQYKILFARSQVTVNMSFVGTENVTALQMAHAFVIRFNDSWASEEFIQYSDDLNIDGQIVNSEDQVNDICSVNSYFEYHPELGVCEASAK